MPVSRSHQVPPATFRSAGALVAVEGVVALAVAVVLVLRSIGGAEQGAANGYGTAGWFAFLGAAVAAAGIALVLGRRWGRALALVVQLLLLPVAWALLTDSHQLLYGVLLGVVVLAVLILLFTPASSQWMAAEYDVDEEDEELGRA